MTDPTVPQHIDTKAIAKALDRTKPSRWANPWFAAAIIGVCITVLSLVANLSLYQWGSDKADQVSTLRAESECRSAVAAREAVAGGALRLKEVQLDRTRSASNQALQEAIVAAIDEPEGIDSPAFAAAINKWAAANSDSARIVGEIVEPLEVYRAALDDRARITEICSER
jgi:hypothetical protein